MSGDPRIFDARPFVRDLIAATRDTSLAFSDGITGEGDSACHDLVHRPSRQRNEPRHHPDGSPWIQTLGGGALDLVNPTPDQIDFRVMARVLARVPRFAGHTNRGVYSVAQHSEQGALAIFRDTGDRLAAAAFLLHDGHEYAIGDDATPKVLALAAHAVLDTGDLNAADVVKRAHKRLKATLDAAIYTAAGMDWPLPPELAAIVKQYDAHMLLTERLARMARPPADWQDGAVEPLEGVDCSVWPEGLAEVLFRAACEDFLPRF